MKTRKLEAILEEQEEEELAKNEPNVITDMSQEALVQLRQSIYFRIMNSIDFEECAHKLLQMHLPVEQWPEVGNMILDCCIEERVFINYYGLLGERLCKSKEEFMKIFHKAFVDRYASIDDYKTEKIRKMAKFFAYLLAHDAIDWYVFRCVDIREDYTTASSRIFLKILFQDLSLYLGLPTLGNRLNDKDMSDNFDGLFPKDSLENMQNAINFFISIGLKGIIQDYQDLFIQANQDDNQEDNQNELGEDDEELIKNEIEEEPNEKIEIEIEPNRAKPKEKRDWKNRNKLRFHEDDSDESSNLSENDKRSNSDSENDRRRRNERTNDKRRQSRREYQTKKKIHKRKGSSSNSSHSDRREKYERRR